MSAADEIKKLLGECDERERQEVFDFLRRTILIHPFEKAVNARAEVILEALARAPDLTVRGVRGIIGEAAFAVEVAARLEGWSDVTPVGNHTYDVALKDETGVVRVQVKMQRRERFKPLIRDGEGIVEVQRTRTGTKGGEATRPYRFGEFDILAACMEPSHGRWNSFLYIPERWLLPRPEDKRLIKIMQPISLQADAVWADNYQVAVDRLRSSHGRPMGGMPIFETGA